MEGTSREDLDMEIANLLRIKMSDFEENDRAIIYYLQKNWAEEVIGLLNEEVGDGEELFGIYHTEMEYEDRRWIYKRWCEGDLLYLIAISTLDTGID
jgi:superfamily II DNA helicase RecQ